MHFNIAGQHIMEERSTQTKRYISWSVEGWENPQELPVSFSLDIMADQFIAIPMAGNVEILVEATLSAPSVEDTVVRMSSADISVEKNVAAEYEDIYMYMDMFFRMQDGSIKTFTELFQWRGAGNARLDAVDLPLRMKHNAVARDPQEIAKISSIIVGNMEYDLNDLTQGKEVQVDPALKPFILKPLSHNGGMLAPVREIAEKLGGVVTYDAAANSVIVQYRGATLEIRNGNYFKDGEQISGAGYSSPAIVNGTMAIDRGIFMDCFGVMVSDVIARDLTETTWFVMP